MAWQAIAHGATGLLWWGSSHEDRPAPFLDDLMTVVAEFRDLHPFLARGDITSVRMLQDTKRYPHIMGVSCVVRRAEDRTLLVLINEDPFPADAIITGLDWANPAEMRPLNEPSSGFAHIPSGYITPMEGSEVRLYVSD